MLFPTGNYDPPYYAVVFTTRRTPGDAGYGETADRMDALAAAQPGYLGIESVRGEDGRGITVSYWRDLASIRAWREQADHRAAREAGRARWYEAYQLRICRVEREYGFHAASGAPGVDPGEAE